MSFQLYSKLNDPMPVTFAMRRRIAIILLPHLHGKRFQIHPVMNLVFGGLVMQLHGENLHVCQPVQLPHEVHLESFRILKSFDFYILKTYIDKIKMYNMVQTTSSIT